MQPVTCNMSSLLGQFPGLNLPSKPTSVAESIYLRGTSLAGNYCPINSSIPNEPCEVSRQS